MRMLTEETTMNISPYVNSTLICHKMPVNGLAVIDAYLFVCVCYFLFRPGGLKVNGAQKKENKKYIFN